MSDHMFKDKIVIVVKVKYVTNWGICKGKNVIRALEYSNPPTLVCRDTMNNSLREFTCPVGEGHMTVLKKTIHNLF